MTTRPRIVCAVDFSESSRRALRTAAMLAERFQSLLTVATVDDPLLATVNGAQYVRPEDSTAHLLHRVVAETIGDRVDGSEIEYIVGVGKPADELLRIARDPRADLIVMSSHGRTGLARLVLGSIAEAVMRAAPCPILIVKPEVKLHTGGAAPAATRAK